MAQMYLTYLIPLINLDENFFILTNITGDFC